MEKREARAMKRSTIDVFNFNDAFGPHFSKPIAAPPSLLPSIMQEDVATSIQAQQRRQIPTASPSESLSSTTANSAHIKRAVKPTVRLASSDTNKVSSSDQNRHLPNPVYRKPTKGSPPHETLRYVKKEGQNERNSAAQNHQAVVSSGPTREGTTSTARRTSLPPGAKTAVSPSAKKPGQERASKGSKPGKIQQLYVKKTTLLSDGKETRDPAASAEASKGVAVDPVLHADNHKTKKEEAFVKETKKVEPMAKEVTIPTETVCEAEKVVVEVSEEREKDQMSDIFKVPEEEENESTPSGSPEEKRYEVGDGGVSAVSTEKEKEGGESERSRVESEEDEMKKKQEEDENSREEERESGSSGKKDSPAGYNEMIKETASRLLEERKTKVRALVGAFETVVDAESSN